MRSLQAKPIGKHVAHFQLQETTTAPFSPPPGDGAAAYIEEQIAVLRPCVYKIGITWHPSKRYYNKIYGYVHDGWTAMHVLMASSPFKCAQMEKDLLRHFLEKPGCYNILKGGENPPPRAQLVFAIWLQPRRTTGGNTFTIGRGQGWHNLE